VGDVDEETLVGRDGRGKRVQNVREGWKCSMSKLIT
jgi:hypothetical protein